MLSPDSSASLPNSKWFGQESNSTRLVSPGLRSHSRCCADHSDLLHQLQQTFTTCWILCSLWIDHISHDNNSNSGKRKHINKGTLQRNQEFCFLTFQKSMLWFDGGCTWYERGNFIYWLFSKLVIQIVSQQNSASLILSILMSWNNQNISWQYQILEHSIV